MNPRDCFHCGSSATELVRVVEVTMTQRIDGPIELRRCRTCRRAYEFYVAANTSDYRKALGTPECDDSSISC